MAASIGFQLWGRLIATDESRAGSALIDLGATRQSCLLAMLLMSPGNPVAVERIVAGIWGSRPPQRVHNVLATYASRLRRALEEIGGMPISFISGGYLAACDPSQIDVHRARLLARRARKLASGGHDEQADGLYGDALALCEGVPLAGLRGEWAERTRGLLESERRATLMDHIDVRLRLGRHEGLLADLSYLAAEHPTDTRVVEAFMVALHRSGRRRDALAAYRDARRASVNELGLEPSNRLQRLERAILQDDPSLAWSPDRSPDRSPVPTSPALWPRPAQLPPDIGDFVGRSRLLAEVTHNLTAPVVLTGVPGAGKTALLVRAAHHMRPEFPDGQLFADLGATSSRPADAHDVLARFLRALGVPGGSVPADPDERCALYRSLLSDQRVLVVLDDAGDEAQVRPLLPSGRGCGVLIGGRRRLTGLEGATTVHIGMMSHAEALELLSRTAGARQSKADSAAALEVCRLCGFLPLAIRVAGAQLAAMGGLPVAAFTAFAAELADERHRLDRLRTGDLLVRASFAVSYQRLPELPRRLLRRLGLLQAPDFAAWVAAAVLDAPAAVAGVALAELVSANLVDATAAGHAGQIRYRIHDLVRIFARERAELEEPAHRRKAAVRRAIRGWLATAERITITGTENAFTFIHGRPLCPVPRHVAAALPSTVDRAGWLESELACLVVAVDQAAQEDLARMAWHLAGALVDLFEVRGHHAEWRRTHTAALAVARRTGDTVGTATMLQGLGYLEMAQDKYESALALLEQAAGLFAAAGVATAVADSAASAAVCHRLAGRLDRAAAQAERSGRISAEVGYLLGQAHARYEQGVGLREQGQLTGAARCMEDALSLATAGSFPRARGIILRGLGIVHGRLGNDDQAISYYEQAREVLAGLGDELRTAHATLALAEAQLNSGRHNEAATLLRDCMDVFHTHQDQYGAALALCTRAKLRNRSREPECAVDDLRAAERIWHRLGMPLWQARTLRDLGDTETALGRGEQAATAWKLALSLLNGLRVPETLEISKRLHAQQPR